MPVHPVSERQQQNGGERWEEGQFWHHAGKYQQEHKEYE